MADGTSTATSPNNSIRPLSCELSVLSDANGSAVWKSGGTMVLASCHGPAAPRQAQLPTTKTSTTTDRHNNVVVQVLLPGSLRHASEWEVFLTNVLSACVCSEACPPNSIIQIVLQIQSDDGSVLAACVHAAVSALMDASVELNYLPVAVSCCLISTAKIEDVVGVVGVDLDPPLALEEQGSHVGLVTLVVVPPTPHGGNDRAARPRLGGMWTSGIRAKPEHILQCWNMAQEASLAVTAFWRMALNHKHQQHAQTLFSGM